MPQSESNEASIPAGSRPLRRRLVSVAVISISLVCAATLCAAFAREFWIGDLAAHFRVQYAALSLLGFIFFAWLRKPWLAAAALAALAVNITSASSAMGWGEHAPLQTALAANSGETLRVASINVYYRNTEHERVVRFLREQRPDVAVLVEITPVWRRALDSLSSIYSYRYYSNSPVQRDGIRIRRGVLLMSRWPIEHTEQIDFGDWAEAGISATLNVRGRELHVMGVHPCWPLGARISAERNREFAQIARIARSIRGPLVVLGDFNATAFSPHFQALLAQSGLKSAAFGAGWRPTWPTFLPFAGIQIDHALVSRDLTVVDFERGPRVGSDHWPIVVELLPQARLAHNSP